MGVFWLLTTLVIIANGIIFRQRAEKAATEDSTRREGYLRLANGFIYWLGVPTLLIAVGVLAGWSRKFAAPPGADAPNTPFDLFCELLGLVILLRSNIWVFFQDGADFLAAYGQILQPKLPTTPLRVRVVWGLASAAMLVSWYVQFLQPSLRS